ncbi:hypothetical protein GCM10009835_46850 [Planosporangium flavigriseum]|uniref:Uncharacterized protein n=1 Tax=Planosporangium flavigriseum TaxID=373681 RepID=A0A8J3PK36_9ACTN|nr:hypothetical protein Pfl04_01830 [Planosporangium flavigriseum]
MPAGGEHAVQVVADRPVRHGEGDRERGDEERTRACGAHLEALREEQCYDQVRQQPDGEDEADQVLGVHSFSTPRSSSARPANRSTVNNTKITSDTAPLLPALGASLPGELTEPVDQKPLAEH